MLQAFVPRFLASLSPMASEYLPGDAQNLCVEIANRMERIENDLEYSNFIAIYRDRYARKSASQRAVVELCLIHILKMPFELSTSIRSSLIRY